MRFLSICFTRISLVFLVFLHLRIFVVTDAARISNYQNEKDYFGLMDLKSKVFNDPYGMKKSWNGSVHFCEWPGVTCGRRHKRVTSINLAHSGLVGSLSPFLGNLSFLRHLNLTNNTFQGKIPSEYGHLLRLQTLELSRNSLEGEIPANLSRCSNLIYLSIAHNNLTGRIPEELGSLSKLKTLIIKNNNLAGRIPPSIGNLTLLLRFIAAENSLEGDIPENLGQLKILTILDITDNQLSGIIPPSLYNISSLSVLALPGNRLHGSLPPSLGLMLPHLRFLQLRDNNFSGPLPVSLSNASKLQVIDIVNNIFSGKIAIDFGGLQNLILVYMSSNNFGSGKPDEMNFLSSMTNCSYLQVLSLQGNRLRGVLPEDIGNLSSHLSCMQLGENHIYGGIPSTIGKLFSLTDLALNGNQLRGTIPSSMGSLQKLQRLGLNNNKLSGKIPESLGNLTLLIDLYLHQNMLEGAIPPGLGNCRKLSVLVLSQNKLNDKIPKEIFGIPALVILLDLSGNHLFGSIPFEIGELVNLSELDMSENNLSGEIPESIDKCTSLTKLSLADNRFYGSIPSSFRSLRGIQTINFSHNNFSGQIPLFLENFTLKALDLSFNDLEGEVPTQAIFLNASVVSVVGNRGLCGGITDLQLPNCHFSESKKNKYAVIIPIVIFACLFIAVIWLSYFFICSSKRKSDLFPESPSRRSNLEVTYEKLFKATNGFSSENLIGVGSFGSVYKGVLSEDDGFIVAVKLLNLLHQGASRSFMHECEALREIRHRNLVKIITCCSSIDFQGTDFKALVYEFMPNGSLENWLHSSIQAEEPNIHRKLDLLQRINIVVDVACALDYLHHHCQRQIVHCDIKPSNILLDSDFTAHVGDFGLAKFLPPHTIQNDSNSVGIRGSIGYVAPEYGLGTEVSPHGDVYSYGILLLEMMTGKRPTDSMFVEGLNLHKFVNMAMPEHVIDIVDPILLKVDGAERTNSGCSPLEIVKGSKMEECLISIFHVGLACSMDLPKDRMNMGDVVLKLQSIRNKVLCCKDSDT